MYMLKVVKIFKDSAQILKQILRLLTDSGVPCVRDVHPSDTFPQSCTPFSVSLFLLVAIPASTLARLVCNKFLSIVCILILFDLIYMFKFVPVIKFISAFIITT